MKKIIFTAAAAVMLSAMLLHTVSGIAAAGAEQAPVNKPYQTTDTLSSVASVSKMFAVTAVMQLADQGKVDLDAPVTDYLPDFKMADSRYKNITVRMLMNHSSGLMGSHYADSMFYADRNNLAHDHLLENLRGERLKAEPGAFGCYCNDGFDVLELIAERVSGESYTDYLENHICKPLGMQQTGTPWNAFMTNEQMRVFSSGTEFPPEFDMTFGGGGLLSTAPELAKFGSAFFTGNNLLLSEKSKDEMKQNYAKAEYEDACGLGWDTVNDDAFAAAGVQVVSKGGDLLHQHAELYVAPDENISVGVTCAGGSSTAAKQLAAALMEIALDEKGITVQHQSKPEPKETLDTVPDVYQQYAGLYLTGSELVHLSFPDMKYMEVQTVQNNKTVESNFLYTRDGWFVRAEGNIKAGKAAQASPQELYRFQERGGKVYIIMEQWYGDENLGYEKTGSYFAQKAEPNPLSDSVQKAWDARNGKQYYIVSERYSSAFYNGQQQESCTVSEGYAGSLKIKDATHAETVISIPSSASRDQSDIEFITENGAEYLCPTARGGRYISEDAIPDFTAEISEVPLTTGSASWYNIKGNPFRTILLDIPEHAAVYVYDSRGRVIYSSIAKAYGNTVSLPESGKIVFVGETGEVVAVRQ